LIARDQLLGDQEDLLEQKRKNTSELKILLKLENDKNEKLIQDLAKGKETISSLEGSIGMFFKTRMMSCKRLIKILKCNLMFFGQAL
jgi:hypothetical protein